MDAGQTVYPHRMRAELFKNLVVIALGEQVAVLIAEQGQGPRVGIAEAVMLAMLGGAQPVAQPVRCASYPGFEQAALHRLQRIEQLGPVLGLQIRGLRIRQQGTHHAQAGHTGQRMRAEQRVRVGAAPLQQGIAFSGGQRRRRRILA